MCVGIELLYILLLIKIFRYEIVLAGELRNSSHRNSSTLFLSVFISLKHLNQVFSLINATFTICLYSINITPFSVGTTISASQLMQIKPN